MFGNLNELIKKLETLRRENPAAGELPVAITLADYYDGCVGNAQEVKIGESWIDGEFKHVIIFE